MRSKLKDTRYHLYGKSWSWCNCYWFHGNFTDYNKFERFSNVADAISAKLLSSFLECELLALISDWYGFEFSIKGAEGKHRSDDSTHIQEIKIIDNRKVPKSFQSYLGNSNKGNLVKQVFQKWRETLSYVLTFFQTIYLVNLDGGTDHRTN